MPVFALTGDQSALMCLCHGQSQEFPSLTNFDNHIPLQASVDTHFLNPFVDPNIPLSRTIPGIPFIDQL